MEDDRQLKHVVSVLDDPGEPLPAHSEFLVAHLHHVQGVVSGGNESLSYSYHPADLLVLTLGWSVGGRYCVEWRGGGGGGGGVK